MGWYNSTFDNPVQNLSYQYDKVGNVAQTLYSVNSETSTYSYDTLNRLTSWTLNGTQETYTYDPNTENLSSKAGATYTYDPNHAHAVASLTNGNIYTYDANGNMITRIVGSDTFQLIYDAENRMVGVDKNGSLIASFVYDGDGNHVQSMVGSTTTTFVGNYYEITAGVVTKYYYAGTQRVAMRKDGTLYFMLSDQLGSTSVTTDSSGQNPTTLEYDPWGGTRFASKDGNGNDNTPTNYRYTGQRQEPSFGLYFYQARWYDPSIGRFAQADTVVPGGVQGYDRYAYGLNNPVNTTDPTGHDPWGSDPDFYFADLQTYIKASISIQSPYGVVSEAIRDRYVVWGNIPSLGNIPGYHGNTNPYYTGIGPAKVSDAEMGISLWGSNKKWQ